MFIRLSKSQRQNIVSWFNRSIHSAKPAKVSQRVLKCKSCKIVQRSACSSLFNAPPPLLVAENWWNARKSLAPKRGGSRNELTAKSYLLNFAAPQAAFGPVQTKWVKQWKRALLLLDRDALSVHLAPYHPIKVVLQSSYCQFVWIICNIFSTLQKLPHSSYADDRDDPEKALDIWDPFFQIQFRSQLLARFLPANLLAWHNTWEGATMPR